VTLLYFADTRFPIERANGTQTMATCHELAARGHDVRLIVRPDTATPARDPFAFYGRRRESRLTFAYVAGPRRGAARRAAFLLAALQRVRSAPGAITFTRDLGLAAFLLQLPRSHRPRLIYESHGLAPVVAAEMPALLGKPALRPSARKLRRLDRRESRVWKRAASYVAITPMLVTDLTSRYGSRGRTFVVPDGADPIVSVPAAAAVPTAGYAGHLYPWKGVDVFVQALALTRGIRGLVVGGHPGESDLARVQALARTLSVDTRLTITGLVPPHDVVTRLAAATMLILPNTASAISDRYTSPLKLFEYLTLGRPIVASDLQAFRAVLTPGRHALFVPPDDPGALAAAMERVATDPDLAAALGAAAHALAPEYSWARRAERLEAAIEAARSA
jgi:glycosyltransferase involved in cell wall biosynthesis